MNGFDLNPYGSDVAGANNNFLAIEGTDSDEDGLADPDDLAFLQDVLDVLLLDVRGIAEHVLAEADHGRGRVDGPVEAGLREAGQVAAVVDVRVGQEDAGETGFPGHGHHQIEAVQLLAEVGGSVEEPAPAAGRIDQMHLAVIERDEQASAQGHRRRETHRQRVDLPACVPVGDTIEMHESHRVNPD